MMKWSTKYYQEIKKNLIDLLKWMSKDIECNLNITEILRKKDKMMMSILAHVDLWLKIKFLFGSDNQ